MVLPGFRKLSWMIPLADQQTVTMTFFWSEFGFGKCFGVSCGFPGGFFLVHHWADCCQLSYKIHFLLHTTVGSRNGLFSLHKKEKTTLKNDDFLICRQLMRHPLMEFFHLFNLLQMLNDHRMVNVEFFGNFLCRITFNDPLSWSLSTSDDQSLHSSPSRLLSPLQNFLIHHCTVHSLAVLGSNASLMLWAISAALHFELKKLLEFAFCLTSFP